MYLFVLGLYFLVYRFLEDIYIVNILFINISKIFSYYKSYLLFVWARVKQSKLVIKIIRYIIS